MSVKIDSSGRRSVQSEVVVEGTPEQVWQAIATGPGVSSWFVPCELDGREGGEIVASFGPGMESTSTITAWNPPKSFSAEGGEISPGAPVMATEWTVEARGGGTCLIRVVHSWFAESDEWDSQFEGTELGWPAFFRDLKLYLAHFVGQPSATCQLMGFSAKAPADAFQSLQDKLGLRGKKIGDPVEPIGDHGPQLSGEIKNEVDGEHPEMILLCQSPLPGIAHFFAMPMGDMSCLSIRLFFYGDRARETAEQQGLLWNQWVEENFPMPLPPAH